MSSDVSLGRFRIEIEPYNHFILTYEDPLTPLSFSAHFDHIAVSLSASPYIALKNSDIKLCISHIGTIKRYGSNTSEKGFIIMCDDYSLESTPSPVRFSLKCY